MTEVAFHFNLADKVGYTCRLLRKAYRSGGPVGVVGEAELLRTLDSQLWEFSALDFIPHCGPDAEPAVRAASPIVLVTDAASLKHSETLIHLGSSVPSGFERFQRLIEIVGSDAEDRRLARERWRYYADRGYTLKSHDMGEHRRGHR